MDEFAHIGEARNDLDAMYRLAKCVAIAMQQYKPEIATLELVEDSMDLKTMYEILELCADIKVGKNNEHSEVQQTLQSAESQNWDTFDLAKLEAEAFLLGIWKDYEELELSMSMPELTATLSAKREIDYQDKKFMAAMQGVNLDEKTGRQEEDPWEKLKARAAARARGENPDTATVDPNDITSFKGAKAQQAGFGIGMGLEYQTM